MSSSESSKPKLITKWGDLISVFNCFSNSDKQWIFRGQGDCDHDLQSALERAIVEYGIEDGNDYANANKEEKLNKRRKVLKNGLDNKLSVVSVVSLERGFIRKFQRQCYHYRKDVPDEENILEWLALMRHYGAPTRLLDWTYSFFVAVFFAMENAKIGKNCKVFALDTNWLGGKARAMLPSRLWIHFKRDECIRKKATFEYVFGGKKPFVLAVNPFRLNKRLVLQKGIFLCPTDVSAPFEDNLAPLRAEKDCTDGFKEYEIKNDLETKKDILIRLHRMNISRTTLFPGLDGFAQSLKTLLALPELIAPKRSPS